VDLIPERTNVVARRVVDAAFAVHSELGPGLLESVYEVCFAYELGRRRLSCAREVAVPIVYGNIRLAAGLRLDMVVDDRVVVELKSVDAFAPVHTAQMLSYLKLSDLRLGLLINFNVPLIKDGIKRIVR